MKKTLLYAGLASLLVAAILAVAGFTHLDMRLSASLPTNVHIYPAAFFALLGLFLLFQGVKSRLRS